MNVCKLKRVIERERERERERKRERERVNVSKLKLVIERERVNVSRKRADAGIYEHQVPLTLYLVKGPSFVWMTSSATDG